MLDANGPTSRDSNTGPQRKPATSAPYRAGERWITQFVRSGLPQLLTAGILGAITLLFCQCHQPSSTPTPTPSSTVTPTPTATPGPTATVVVTPTVTPSPTASTPPLLSPTASPTPDAFEEGIKKLLKASENGFLEMRGKFQRTEDGSGPNPLFRVRKIYAGTFLLEGATSAILEEVYFGAGPQPAYNYHVYYQSFSGRRAVEKYDDLRLNLNRLLQGFEHTFGDRYDAWARKDPLKTAILLSSNDLADLAGSPEIQVHAAFSAPQW
jgi:hypothetical protein